MSSESKILLNYKIIKNIGKGNFSTVKLAIDKETGEKIAIKILDKEKIKNIHDMKRIEREISMVKNIAHLNIAKVLDIKEDDSKYYIIMEYCEKGELFNLILEKRKLNEEESAYYFYQIINGLEHIHLNNIIHRDLKPENLLLTKNNILKIIDFGLSNYNTENNLLSTPCGSPCYASPEMISGEKYNGFTSDVWSTGIILYAMIYGYLPFENINNDNDILFQKIRECKIDYPRNNCLLALDLLKKILVVDPNERIKIEDIKKHKFYKKGKSIFYHKHKHKYKDLKIKSKLNQENKYINETKNKESNSTEKIKLTENICIDGCKNIKFYETQNSNNYEVFDSNENQKLINNNNKKYRSKEKKNNEISTKISKKKLNEEEKLVINDEYFSNENNIKCNRKVAYLLQKNEDTELNNINDKTNNITRDKYIIVPPIKIDKISKNDLSNRPNEKEDESKISRKASYLNKIFLRRKIPFSDNKKYSLKKEIIPTLQNKSELNNQIKMKNEFSDKYPYLKEFSIEHGNEYYYNPLSQLEKTTPLNECFEFNLGDDDIDKNKIKKKKKSADITAQNSNKRIHLESYSKNGKISKKIIKKSDRNKKFYIIGGKKYCINIKRDNISEKKNKFLSKRNKNKEEKEEEYKNAERYSYDNERRININNKLFLKKNSNCIMNSTMKELRPISTINYNPNNLLMIRTPNKKDFHFAFFERNKKNYEKKGGNKNYSFNTDIKQYDKNILFVNDNQINEDKLRFKNESSDNKIKEIKNQRRNDIHRKKYIINKIKVEEPNVINNIIIYTSNNNNSNEHINNKTLLKENKSYFKNIYLNQNKKERNNEDNHSTETMHKIGKIKYFINNSKCLNNKYTKIISNSKRDLNSKYSKNRLCSSVYNESCTNCPDNNTGIIIDEDVKGIKTSEKRWSKAQEEILKDKDKNKYYKSKIDKLRFTDKKIYNKFSEKDITKLSKTNKALSIKNYLNYDINGKENNIYKAEVNEESTNPRNNAFMHRNINKNCISKNLLEKNKYSYKTSIINEEQKINGNHEKTDNSCNKDNNNTIRNLLAANIITNISKMNIGNFPSITIDMNVLNKNNQKYLKLYDAIKNKI